MSLTHTPHEPEFNPALRSSSFTGKQPHHPTHPSAPTGTSLKPPPLEAQTSWVKFALTFCLSLWWHFGNHASPAPTWSQLREEGVVLAAAQGCIQPNLAPSPHPQHRKASLSASLVAELSLFLLSSSFLQAAYQHFSKQQRHFLGTKDPRSNTSCSSSDVCLPLTTHTDTFPELSAPQRVKTKPQQTGDTGKRKNNTRVPPTSPFGAKHPNPTAQDGFGAPRKGALHEFCPIAALPGRQRHGWGISGLEICLDRESCSSHLHPAKVTSERSTAITPWLCCNRTVTKRNRPGKATLPPRKRINK